MALRVTLFLVRRFGRGATPVSSEEIADELELPLPLTHRVLDELTASGVLKEVQSTDNYAQGFMPARDVEHFTISYILEALETRGVNGIPLPESPDFKALSEALDTLRQTIQTSPANKLLKDI